MSTENILGTPETHPSYGTVAFSRVQGSPHPLFGSSIEHSNTVTLKIYRADETRGLNQDWIMGKHLLSEVEMSYSQFVEAITNMNVGTGVPCTIRFLAQEGLIPSPTFKSKAQQFQEELQEDIQEAQQQIDKSLQSIQTILAKKSISKSDRQSILEEFQKVVKLQQSQIPFLAKQFHRQMDKTVQEAKGEVESFIQNKMYSLMQEQLTKENLLSDTPLVEIPDTHS